MDLAFGDQDVATITPRQIERALSDLKNEGRKVGEEVRYRQPATLVPTEAEARSAEVVD